MHVQLSRLVTRLIIAAVAVILLVVDWPIMGWQSIPLSMVTVVFLLAADNSNRQRKLKNKK